MIHFKSPPSYLHVFRTAANTSPFISCWAEGLKELGWWAAGFVVTDVAHVINRAALSASRNPSFINNNDITIHSLEQDVNCIMGLWAFCGFDRWSRGTEVCRHTSRKVMTDWSPSEIKPLNLQPTTSQNRATHQPRFLYIQSNLPKCSESLVLFQLFLIINKSH